MSKLTRIRAALSWDRRIEVVDMREICYIPHRGGGVWSQTVDIFIAARQACYDPTALQALMLSLVPGLEPTCQDDFRLDAQRLTLGKLYFDEIIGSETVQRRIVLKDRTLRRDEQGGDGERSIDETMDLVRRIWVRPFPDIASAERALGGGYPEAYIFVRDLPIPFKTQPETIGPHRRFSLLRAIFG